MHIWNKGKIRTDVLPIFQMETPKGLHPFGVFYFTGLFFIFNKVFDLAIQNVTNPRKYIRVYRTKGAVVPFVDNFKA